MVKDLRNNSISYIFQELCQVSNNKVHCLMQYSRMLSHIHSLAIANFKVENNCLWLENAKYITWISNASQSLPVNFVENEKEVFYLEKNISIIQNLDSIVIIFAWLWVSMTHLQTHENNLLRTRLNWPFMKTCFWNVFLFDLMMIVVKTIMFKVH